MCLIYLLYFRVGSPVFSKVLRQDFELLYVVPESKIVSVQQVANCVQTEFSKPLFHLYFEATDELILVSTFKASTVEVTSYNLDSGQYSVDLRGHVIRASYPPNIDEVIFKPDLSQPSIIRDVMGILAKSLNFTPQFLPPMSGTYGISDADGNFNGVIGDLQHGRADIGIAILYAFINHK